LQVVLIRRADEPFPDVPGIVRSGIEGPAVKSEVRTACDPRRLLPGLGARAFLPDHNAAQEPLINRETADEVAKTSLFFRYPCHFGGFFGGVTLGFSATLALCRTGCFSPAVEGTTAGHSTRCLAPDGINSGT
jgi:hypothetical protein